MFINKNIQEKGGVPGIEPGTSSSLTKHHTSRLNTHQYLKYKSILFNFSNSIFVDYFHNEMILCNHKSCS